jgi:hypothetical protein
MVRVLWWCAGADPTLIRRATPASQNRQAIIGAMVLAPALLSLFSMGTALALVLRPTDEHPGLVASVISDFSVCLVTLVWAAIVLTLDRSIVCDVSREVNVAVKTKALRFGARFALAVIIGIVISKPLEIRLLRSELDASLERSSRAERDRLNALDAEQFRRRFDELEVKRVDVRRQIAEERAELGAAQKELEEQQKSVEREAEGRSASGRSGEGPAFRQKLRHLDDLKTEFANRRAAQLSRTGGLEVESSRLEARIVALNAERAAREAQNELTANQNKGLAKRLELAHEEYPTMGWMLTLLFLTIEVLPLIVKFSYAPLDYEEAVAQRIGLAVVELGITEHLEETTDSKGNFVILERDLALENATAEQLEAHEMKAELRSESRKRRLK